MTLREQIINLKGGGCETCSEKRAPALMVLVDHERTSSWERYWSEVFDIASATPERIRIRCRNCAACEALTRRRTPTAAPNQATPNAPFYVVRLGPNNEPPPWLPTAAFAVLLKNDGSYITHPAGTPWEGKAFQLPPPPFSYEVVHGHTD